ncbi:PAAR domain-containing protein [Massilia sp. TWR1-2-2]|uniref:PAAR domain-containing protein n=1 Tax=Massilia sp. TWR1-2-2 TaxID=2804584 RepID=UPI003CEC7E3E
MAGEIIRLGDPTSHGGKVIEGSPADICHGKPIALVGHRTFCPQCKGIFPIIEGAPTTTFYGKGVALAGMKTACGAVLIATQLTDTVQVGGGGERRTIPNSNRDSQSEVTHRPGVPPHQLDSACQDLHVKKIALSNNILRLSMRPGHLSISCIALMRVGLR